MGSRNRHLSKFRRCNSFGIHRSGTRLFGTAERPFPTKRYTFSLFQSSLLPRRAHWRAAAGSSRPSTPDGFCAAGSSRSSTPDALAPQARLDPPPGWRARRGLLPSARTAGCVVAFVIAELRAPSRSSTAGGATPHASQSCSREPPPPPLVCPLRGAPLGLAAPPPPCTLAHASASASADRLSWATSRLQLGANLAADRTGARTGASTRAALVHSRARRAP